MTTKFCTPSWLLDGIFLNDTGGGKGTLQKGTVNNGNAIESICELHYNYAN